ncbi:cytochrome bc1 complex Rieske iron-sulfur subunit [Phytohabitans rumicis]|uniref:Cytochrome bc1 complex Rieske iron-sulfur subunit n=1 Tax=Phytohabitans rumicis TaxID=1076125 RepID=A0A6V8KXD8_9ACTN|nr:ubiquinol-cytochrome c reductase iron-sulfur subunit [Phytohabitans rumicis]GFJ87338.1 ubiquinol-cytochrome c reductase iron-sulfur subunit [Phytohabitans rumicis]
MSTETHGAEREEVDVFDPRLSRFEIVREGARRDGVEIVHYEDPYPVKGTKEERRMVRTVALCFLITGLAGTAFMVIYIWWPWAYDLGSNNSKLYTPLLGLTLGVSLLGVGFGILIWGKRLLPHEISIQDRHDGNSGRVERRLTGESIVYMGDELGFKRRKTLGLAAMLGLTPVGLAVAAPFIGGFIKSPTKDAILFHTGWDPAANGGKPVRLTREDGTPIRPEDVSVGGQMTVFPGIPEGATNEHADSPTLLIHLRAEDSAKALASAKPINKGSQWENFVAYSKICTHAGCPASLYEQQTNRLLCPCHQSQFLITDNARPIFGPATRTLPQLPITVDEEGFFVATSDYKVAVGPAFWERP